MQNIVTLKLMPNQFQILTPTELIVTSSVTIQSMDQGDQDTIKDAIETIWSQWYVVCVGGELVSLWDLKYWDVEKQEIYARPRV
jgi:hypothetical protein